MIIEKLRGKTALITGGTKGIGFGIAEAMLDAGMNVLITGRSQTRVDQVVKKISINDRERFDGIEADVCDLEEMNTAVAKCIEKFGTLDVLIANAGVGHFGNIQDLTSEQWKQTIDTNLTGVFNSVKSSLDELERTKGYIFTIASLAGVNFFAGGTAYNASKFGLVGFTQALMLDVRHQGINVSTIMPGSVSSHFNGHIPGELDAWKIQPEDIGEIVLDLLKINPRTLPSKVEIRPSQPPKK